MMIVKAYAEKADIIIAEVGWTDISRPKCTTAAWISRN
jgi:hypothetical protein